MAFLKRLAKRVSIVPVVCKADTMTTDEARTTATLTLPLSLSLALSLFKLNRRPMERDDKRT